MAVLCLLTNTRWPWPTPAEAASARGGFPTLGTEWRGRSEAEVCTSEARKIRVLLARARGGASQEGLVSLLGAERMRSHFVVAVAMGPALRAGPRLLRNSLLRKRQRWATSNQTTDNPERYRCVLGFQTAHCTSLASGLGRSFCCRSSPSHRHDLADRGVARLTDSELRRARRDVVRRGIGGFIAGWLGLERPLQVLVCWLCDSSAHALR